MAKTAKRDDFGLDGKVAIVTGGGAPDDGIGNGRAAAILLARSGAKVLVVDIEREAADQTVRMIEAGAAPRAHSSPTSRTRPSAGRWSTGR